MCDLTSSLPEPQSPLYKSIGYSGAGDGTSERGLCGSAWHLGAPDSGTLGIFLAEFIKRLKTLLQLGLDLSPSPGRLYPRGCVQKGQRGEAYGYTLLHTGLLPQRPQPWKPLALDGLSLSEDRQRRHCPQQLSPSLSTEGQSTTLPPARHCIVWSQSWPQDSNVVPSCSQAPLLLGVSPLGKGRISTRVC